MLSRNLCKKKTEKKVYFIVCKQLRSGAFNCYGFEAPWQIYCFSTYRKSRWEKSFVSSHTTMQF